MPQRSDRRHAGVLISAECCLLTLVSWLGSSAAVCLSRPYANIPCSVLQVGMTFTIEPILVEQGTGYRTWKDDWTVVAKDGGLSAQWEHTVLITPTGYEILTLP